MTEGRARRLRGVERQRNGSAKSRNGSRVISALNAHSIGTLQGQRIYGVGTGLYADAVSIANSAVFDGSRLTFTKAPPTAGVKPYLFISGGGYGAKLDEAHEVTRWGIEAPPDGATVELLPELVKTIHACDDITNVNPKYSGGISGPLEEVRLLSTGLNAAIGGSTYDHADSADNSAPSGPMEGADAIIIANDPEGDYWGARYYPGGFSVDLTVYGDADATESTKEDYISLYLWVLKETRLEWIQISFPTATGGFDLGGYSVKLEPVASTGFTESVGEQVVGLGDFTPEDLTLLVSKNSANSSFSPTSFLAPDSQWVRLFIPKTLFTRYGAIADEAAPATAGDWSTVTGWEVQLKRINNRYDHVVIDHIHLTGAHGLHGDYKWHYRYENSATGSASNPNPTAIELEGIKRQGARISLIPRSTDPQVDRIAFYRTVGGGTEFFRSWYVDNPASGTATWDDIVADYAGLDSGETSQILQDEEIVFDNTIPDVTYERNGGPFRGRAYLSQNTATGQLGRVGYTAVDRAEGLQGFLQLGSADEVASGLIVWQGRLWVFTATGIWAIDDNDVPTPTYVTSPGTIAPDTISSSPYGILYAALDGLRLFDGSGSRLLTEQTIGALFTSDAALEGYAPFAPSNGVYFDGEYLVSDGSTSFAVALADGAVRDLGVGFGVAFADNLYREVLANSGGQVVQLEARNTKTDAGAPVPFVLDTGDVRLPGDRRGILREFWIDAETHGALLTATAILDGEELSIPPFSHSGRSPVKIGIGREVSTLGLRLEASVIGDPVEVFAIEASVYIPGME